MLTIGVCSFTCRHWMGFSRPSSWLPRSSAFSFLCFRKWGSLTPSNAPRRLIRHFNDRTTLGHYYDRVSLFSSSGAVRQGEKVVDRMFRYFHQSDAYASTTFRPSTMFQLSKKRLADLAVLEYRHLLGCSMNDRDVANRIKSTVIDGDSLTMLYLCDLEDIDWWWHSSSTRSAQFTAHRILKGSHALFDHMPLEALVQFLWYCMRHRRWDADDDLPRLLQHVVVPRLAKFADNLRWEDAEIITMCHFLLGVKFVHSTLWHRVKTVTLDSLQDGSMPLEALSALIKLAHQQRLYDAQYFTRLSDLVVNRPDNELNGIFCARLLQHLARSRLWLPDTYSALLRRFMEHHELLSAKCSADDSSMMPLRAKDYNQVLLALSSIGWARHCQGDGDARELTERLLDICRKNPERLINEDYILAVQRLYALTLLADTIDSRLLQSTVLDRAFYQRILASNHRESKRLFYSVVQVFRMTRPDIVDDRVAQSQFELKRSIGLRFSQFGYELSCRKSLGFTKILQLLQERFGADAICHVGRSLAHFEIADIAIQLSPTYPVSSVATTGSIVIDVIDDTLVAVNDSSWPMGIVQAKAFQFEKLLSKQLDKRAAIDSDELTIGCDLTPWEIGKRSPSLLSHVHRYIQVLLQHATHQ